MEADNCNKTNDALQAQEEYKNSVESTYEYLEHFDILETITNVGNDEVFTPRKTCDMILDALPGEVWQNPNYRWLNPATKNGIFEREIALRLDAGLKSIIKDEEQRKKHILQNMIFSLGQTKFTANVARRTLYYCCEANRKCDGIKDSQDDHYVNGYAIGNGTWFNSPEGNIKTPKVDHVFGKDDKCIFCRVSKDSKYIDSLQREQYAYEFIHTKKEELLQHLQDIFFKGDRTMKFDIIIGNPPYQLSDGGAQASARPIYNLFIERAIELEPKYICMIIPSRWMAGGKNLDDFRGKMIKDTHIEILHDYINPKECFPNNDIKGGVCFFVRNKDYTGKAHIFTHTNGKISQSERYLKEDGCDVFIREEQLIPIKNKVNALREKSFSTIVSARKSYGLEAETMVNPEKFKIQPFSEKEIKGGLKILGLDKNAKRTWMYLSADYPIPKKSQCLHKYKVFIAEAYGCGAIGEVPSTPVLGTPGELCTETFLEIGPLETETEARNLIKYIKTKFFRLLVGIKKQTQHTTKKIYEFVPLLDFTDRSSIAWNMSIKEIDDQLYKKYGLSTEEIDYIEENIREMI